MYTGISVATPQSVELQGMGDTRLAFHWAEENPQV